MGAGGHASGEGPTPPQERPYRALSPARPPHMGGRAALPAPAVQQCFEVHDIHPRATSTNRRATVDLPPQHQDAPASGKRTGWRAQAGAPGRAVHGGGQPCHRCFPCRGRAGIGLVRQARAPCPQSRRPEDGRTLRRPDRLQSASACIQPLRRTSMRAGTAAGRALSPCRADQRTATSNPRRPGPADAPDDVRAVLQDEECLSRQDTGAHRECRSAGVEELRRTAPRRL